MSAAGACASTGNRAEREDSLRARCEANGSARDCRILSLTAERVFVESFVPNVTGSSVKLRFRLPNGHQVCTSGVVRDHKFQIGFDVALTELSADDRDQIKRFVS
jgi:hypothetical protein